MFVPRLTTKFMPRPPVGCVMSWPDVDTWISWKLSKLKYVGDAPASVMSVTTTPSSVQKAELTGRIGDECMRDVDARQRRRDAWEHAALLVFRAPADRAALYLRDRRGGGEEQERECRGDTPHNECLPSSRAGVDVL